MLTCRNTLCRWRQRERHVRECRDSANPCQTIGYAISQATDSDTIFITGDTYSENLIITGISITLRGGYTISEANWLPGTEETIIDGGNADRVFLIHDSNSVLENLTITGGYGSGGGGGVWVTNGDVTIRTSTITENASDFGGAGISVNDDWGPAHLALESSIVSSNTGGQYGGMNVFGENATVYIRDVTFVGNMAEAGGGICVEVNSSVVVEDTHIYSNTVNDVGGGIFMHTNSQAQITNTIIEGNNASSGGGVAVLEGASAIISDTNIISNKVEEEGGGIGMWGRPGTVEIANSIISDNYADSYGAVMAEGGTFIGTNLLVVDNRANDQPGIKLHSGTSGKLMNVTVSGNIDDDGEYSGVEIYDPDGSFSIVNSIIWGNGSEGADLDGNNLDVSYSIIEGGWEGEGNVDTDPNFVDPANGDYRLQVDSPSIDAGTNTGAPDHDLDQTPRPQDGDGDGTAITDMGAYEFEQPVEEPAGAFRESAPLVPELTTYIPTPLDVSTEPEVIGANVGFAAASMMLLAFAITLLNKILKEQEINLQQVVSPLKSIGASLTRVESRLGRILGRRSLLDVLKFAGIFIFYGVVFSLLDPSWNPLSVTGFYLFITMTLAFGVVGIADDLVKYNSARHWGVDTNLKLRPANLLLAITSTTFSRLLALVPGIMFGTPAAFEVDESALDEHKKRRLLWITLGTMFVIGFSLWLFTTGTALLQKAQLSDTMAVFVGGLEALLLVVFAVALQNLFVQMLAFPGSVGRDLMHWNRWVWGVILFGITFAFYHTLINPKGNLIEALETANVRNFYLIIGIFVVGVVIAWLILWAQRVWRKGK